MEIKAYGVVARGSRIEPLTIERRAVGPKDVDIEIAYCGVCHSDLHETGGEAPWTQYPCVPGHEIVGRVVTVGKDVTRFAIGDAVGVGCMVGSCMRCDDCKSGLEQFCEKGCTFTYSTSSADFPGHTLGGYSQKIVVNEAFVLKITHEKNLAAVAPLLCAGITMYSPLRHAKVGPGMKVGIVGIGGLGHMGVKLARAMGAHVVGLTTSENKRADILALGAHEVIVWKNENELKDHASSFDVIVNTVSSSHDLAAFLHLLRRDGKMTMVGAPAFSHKSPDMWTLMQKRRSIGGSFIGSIAETQEMLDFCAEHGIVADIELISPSAIADAFARMDRGDVKYRFVIDIASMAKEVGISRVSIAR